LLTWSGDEVSNTALLLTGVNAPFALLSEAVSDEFGRWRLCCIRRATAAALTRFNMALMSKRLWREHETIRAMVLIYCRWQHGSADELCVGCADLLSYATMRLERCRFQKNKPACANCPVHCYRPAYREKVKTVMRHAGPRMLWRHPVLAIRHWLDGFRQAPQVSAFSDPKG
jgi:hypothetical protein